MTQVLCNGQAVDSEGAAALMDGELRERLASRDWTPVECFSPDGWSLHAPGSSDEEIATGDAPPILSGPGRPSREDYSRASEQAFLDAYMRLHAERFGEEFQVN